MPSNHCSNWDYHKWLERRAAFLSFTEQLTQKEEATKKTEMNIDWEVEYKELQIQLIKMRIRCSSYRAGVENALKWLQEEEQDNIHPATNITNLAEEATWARIKTKKHNKENGN